MIVTTTEFKTNLGKYIELVAILASSIKERNFFDGYIISNPMITTLPIIYDNLSISSCIVIKNTE